MKEKRNKVDVFITLWNTFGVVIVVGFLVFTMIIGGGAGLGYQESGRFFVRNHADIVEVSETIWTISRVWGILFWIFIPLTPIGESIISKLKKN